MSALRNVRSYSKRFQNAARAERYARRFESGSRRRIDEREQRAVGRAFAGLPGCRSVLDIPSGAGRFFATLSRDKRRVIEMDVALEILEFARDRSREAGGAAGLAQADASKIPLRDGSVDCVFSNRLLHHIVSVAERATLLREFHRVSRRYAVVSFFNYRQFGALRTILKKLRGRQPVYDEQPTRDAFAGEVARSGFKVLSIVPTGPLWASQMYFVLEKI